jgi:hypothetical protein
MFLARRAVSASSAHKTLPPRLKRSIYPPSVNKRAYAQKMRFFFMSYLHHMANTDFNLTRGLRIWTKGVRQKGSTKRVCPGNKKNFTVWKVGKLE